jgi:CcmD family protein
MTNVMIFNANAHCSAVISPVFCINRFIRFEEQNNSMDSIIKFFSDNSGIIVMLVVLIIWFGIFRYLWKLDKKVKNLEEAE